MSIYDEAFADFGEATKGARKEPLDFKGSYDEALADFPGFHPTPTQVSEEVIQDVTAKPVGRPAGPKEDPTDTGAVFPQLSENIATGMQEGQRLGLSPYVTGGSYGTGIEEIQQTAMEAGKEMSLEGRESVKEWYREEGLPATGALLGSFLAPATGGTSFWGAVGLSAAGAGAGGFLGEATEQILKKEGAMQLAIEETVPQNGWDIMERSTIQSGKEAVFDAMGGLFFRGLSHVIKKGIKATSKPRVLLDGTVVDQGAVDLAATVRKAAEEKGFYEGEAILASQLADVAHFNFLEDVAKASYIGSKRVEKVLDKQAEVITQEAKGLVGDLTTQPKALVAEDSFLKGYYKANLENNNDFVVAGLVRKAFTAAQDQQKSIARAIYKTMDSLANKTDVRQVMKEVPTGFFNVQGEPITVLEAVTKEENRYPVMMQEVREWASDKIDDSLLKADPILGEILDFPMEASMKQVGEVLSELQGRSRTLKNAMQAGTAAENAPRRKLLLDEAVSLIDNSYNDAIKLADDDGILAPDGRTLWDLKEEASGIWAQQVKDFQNDAIVHILENTDLTNGAPEELVGQFLKSPANAEKILEALRIGKSTLEGEALDRVFRAEEMMKGVLIERVLLPVDPLSKTFGLPNTKMFTDNSVTLKMLLGDETYEATRRLVSASEKHSASLRSNTMAFAQKARESGMVLQGVKGAIDKDPSVINKVGSVLIVALGAGRVLTKPKNLRFAEALDDPTVSPAYKRRAFRFLMEEWTHYVSQQEDALSPEKRAHLKELEAARREDMELGKVANK